jgi:hypothetical protein
MLRYYTDIQGRSPLHTKFQTHKRGIHRLPALPVLILCGTRSPSMLVLESHRLTCLSEQLLGNGIKLQPTFRGSSDAQKPPSMRIKIALDTRISRDHDMSIRWRTM